MRYPLSQTLGAGIFAGIFMKKISISTLQELHSILSASPGFMLLSFIAIFLLDRLQPKIIEAYPTIYP